MDNYREYFFFLTNNCPNRCKYCYIDFHSKDMTIEQIDKYMEELKPSRIIFFGGEPLLRLDLIKYTVKKYYGKCKFQVVTSTMANFKEFIEFHKKYKLNEVQLSWDGFTNSRVDINGNSIADRVNANIEYALEQGITFDIKTVVNNENIYKLKEIHDHFKALKYDTKYPGKANGEFVIAHGENYSEDFYEELEKQLPYTFDLDKLYVEHLNKIGAWLRQDRSFCSCDIGKYTTISPEGIQNNCTAMSQQLVRLDDTRAQRRCKHEDCQKCEYGAICDGGCRYERYEKFGDDWENHYLDCTCRITKIFGKTIKNFLASLTPEEKKVLLKKYLDYTAWTQREHNITPLESINTNDKF